MRILVVLMLFLPTISVAGEWAALNGEEIGEVLSDRKVEYASAWQIFHASGRTNYNAGSDSWGNWAVRGDQYCSQWPPAESWVCYDIALDDSERMIRFVDEGGTNTDGQLVTK